MKKTMKAILASAVVISLGAGALFAQDISAVKKISVTEKNYSVLSEADYNTIAADKEGLKFLNSKRFARVEVSKDKLIAPLQAQIDTLDRVAQYKEDAAYLYGHEMSQNTKHQTDSLNFAALNKQWEIFSIVNGPKIFEYRAPEIQVVYAVKDPAKTASQIKKDAKLAQTKEEAIDNNKAVNAAYDNIIGETEIPAIITEKYGYLLDQTSFSDVSLLDASGKEILTGYSKDVKLTPAGLAVTLTGTIRRYKPGIDERGPNGAASDVNIGKNYKLTENAAPAAGAPEAAAPSAPAVNRDYPTMNRFKIPGVKGGITSIPK